MSIFDKFLKNRDAFAVSMVFCSGPLNYALRDGIGLAPNNTAFSMLFMFGWIFFVLPYRNFKKLYKNDTPLTLLAVVYLLVTVAYMFIYTKEYYLPLTVKLYDCVVIFLSAYFLYFISTFSEEKLRLNFLKISIAISFVGTVSVMLLVLTNPNFVLGQRLALSFNGDSAGDAMGNPHIYGRGAVFGIVSSLVYLKYETVSRYRTMTYFALLIFLAMLVLAQAMSSILGGFGIIACFLWFNTSWKSLSKYSKKIFSKWYFWVILILLIGKGIDFIQKNEAIVDLAYTVIERRIEKLANTFLPEEDSPYAEEVEEDQSALGRVATMGIVWETLQENFEDGQYQKIIFGNGYYALYVDVPIIEVFNSYGLFGLVIFSIFFFSMLRYALKEMRNPQTIIGEFAAYGFVYFFIFTFTNGLIMDYNRWTFFALMCRFMSAKNNFLPLDKLRKL
ncbi:hypothetical protein LAG90_03600 [Marinilongibacter aquaticus]|uniref:O-antigen ligase family protein n=1 Tax=Marinilongibacter aquaticus TaxID=2975157 RepID=UPI0021BD2C1D|nr:hypothetical protein [Marinilongibacter aquaticus]UBM59734.1 hypothetical protein LAG90_03600 [Marinilongibacter aquaticus]